MIGLISAISYALGGDGRIPYLGIKGFNAKLWRWLMGIPIGVVYGLIHHQWICIITATIAYLLATMLPYGEKSYLNFLGEKGKFIFCGLAFGACSFTMLPVGWALLQTLLGGLSFYLIKVFDDDGVIGNPWVELLRGFFGAIVIW